MTHEFSKGKASVLIIPQSIESGKGLPEQRLDKGNVVIVKPKPTTTRTEADRKWHLTKKQAK